MSIAREFFYHQIIWMGQIDTVRETTIAFSGPQFFTAIIAGLLLTFGFQMLLTNLSIAAGMSVLSLAHHDDDDRHHSSSGIKLKPIGTALGVWTVVSVSIALFIACLLAVKLSIINNAITGATIGLTIWAAYFTILIWISSTTVGSLVGSVVSTATRGFQAVFGTATAALGMKAANSEIVSTAEAAAAAVRREMTAYIDPQEVRDSVRDVFAKVRSPELDVKAIRAEFERMLQDADLKKVDRDRLPAIDRHTFEQLIAERTDLSARDAKRLVDELDSAWRKATGDRSHERGGLGELLERAKSAKPQDLLSGDWAAQLVGEASPVENRLLGDNQDNNNGNNSALQQGLSTLMGILLGRADLSDLDLNKIKGQIDRVQHRVQDGVKKVTQPQLSPAASVIRADVERYLNETYSWQMTPDRIERDFRQTLYDANADARSVRQGIEAIDPAEFTTILESRGVFTKEKIAELAAILTRVRNRVIEDARAAEAVEMQKKLQQQIDLYLRSTSKERLLSGEVAQDFKNMLADEDTEPRELYQRLVHLQQYRYLSILYQRTDLSDAEKEQIAQMVAPVMQVAIADAEQMQMGIQERVRSQWQKVQDYLRHTGKDELNPEGIARDFQTLLHDPQTGIHDLKLRAESFERDTLVQLLSQRQDITPERANEIVDRVESSWKQATHAPTAIADKAKAQYEHTTSAIADYLRQTGKEELNPDGIRRDLTLLLQDPKMGLESIRDRLAHMDRDTLVQLLSQREDLSQEEVNATIDRVQDTLREVLRTPKRLAVRAQSQVKDFQSTLADYLRHTHKEELNPEGIGRDVELLLRDPRLGLDRLSDRLAHIDRESIIALLSQREDLSEAEAAQIVDRVLAVRDRFAAQIESVKAKVQSSIDAILNKIRNYLNSLDRPELNYEGIAREVQLLFADPNAGADAIKARLSHFDRDTLVAILSSREDISPDDANRIIDRVENVRGSLLRRAERVQEQIHQRIADLKYQAQMQAEATRKAAATAAWWLFATGLVSGIAAAVGGAIA